MPEVMYIVTQRTRSGYISVMRII